MGLNYMMLATNKFQFTSTSTTEVGNDYVIEVRMYYVGDN